MKTSEEIGELAVALVAAQEAIQNPPKSKANPFHHSRYADLATVLNVTRPALTLAGLAVIQTPLTLENGNIAVTTRIIHKSGQWVEETIDLPLPETKNAAQATGSIITYLRRYSLAAFAGIAQEDDDGNSATGEVVTKGESTINKQQQDELKRLLDQCEGDDVIAEFLIVKKLDTLADVPISKLKIYQDQILGRIEQQAKKKEAKENAA